MGGRGRDSGRPVADDLEAPQAVQPDGTRDRIHARLVTGANAAARAHPGPQPLGRNPAAPWPLNSA